MDPRALAIASIEAAIRTRVLTGAPPDEINKVHKLARAAALLSAAIQKQATPVNGSYQQYLNQNNIFPSKTDQAPALHLLNCDYYACPDPGFECYATFGCGGNFNCEVDYQCNVNGFSCNPYSFEFNCLGQFTPDPGHTFPPYVTTTPGGTIAKTTATLGAEVKQSIFEVTEVGMYLRKGDETPGPGDRTAYGIIAPGSWGIGPFTVFFDELLPGTTYTALPFAISGGGTGQGIPLTFTTEELPPAAYDLKREVLICPFGKNRSDDIIYTIVKLYFSTYFPTRPDLLAILLLKQWGFFNDSSKDLLMTWYNCLYWIKNPPTI